MKSLTALLVLALMPLSVSAHTLCTNDDSSSKKPSFMYFPGSMTCPANSMRVRFGADKVKRVRVTRTETNEKGEKISVTSVKKVRSPLYYLERTSLDETSCKYSSRDKRINMTCERGVSAERMLEVGKKLNNRKLIAIARGHMRKFTTEAVEDDYSYTQEAPASNANR